MHQSRTGGENAGGVEGSSGIEVEGGLVDVDIWGHGVLVLMIEEFKHLGN